LSREHARPLWLRLFWFIGLWAAGVACLAAVGYIIRLWLL